MLLWNKFQVPTPTITATTAPPQEVVVVTELSQPLRGLDGVTNALIQCSISHRLNNRNNNTNNFRFTRSNYTIREPTSITEGWTNSSSANSSSEVVFQIIITNSESALLACSKSLCFGNWFLAIQRRPT